jgi:hypothetical protein
MLSFSQYTNSAVSFTSNLVMRKLNVYKITELVKGHIIECRVRI